MMSTYANPLLNLVWVAVCLAAFAWFLNSERNRRSSTRSGFRALALGLALISLFPCVSASDDSVRLEMMGSGPAVPSKPGDHSSNHDSQTDRTNLATLVRLLEMLESVQITVSLAWIVVFCLFAMAVVETEKSIDRLLPARAGRAPPSL